jgi:ergothioneine biosynthesis protein EgtB
MTPLLALDRAEGLLTDLEKAWARSDALFRMLTPEALAAQPIALRQPFIFYLGHLPAFAWNQVCRGVLGQPSFDPAFDDLFARGIDPVETDSYGAAAADAWPAVAPILSYRDCIREAIRDARAELKRRARTGNDDVLIRQARIFAVVLEHEVMHHETLLYMIQQLPAEQKLRPPGLPPLERGAVAAPARPVAVPGARVRLGADFGDVPFGWDNEFGRLEVEVEGFAIDSTPVRNRELLEFVAAGGYERREHWRDEDWAWRERRRIAHPAMWRRSGGGWTQQTLFDEVPLDEVLDWPVYVSWAEARAFARWRGARLPMEAQWHQAAYGTPHRTMRSYPWGEEQPSPRHGNFGLHHWSPVPVGRFPEGASAWGVLDLVGNGWEWTDTVFGPWPGFTPYIRTYPGYSVDFFDGRHYVLRGASWATDEALIRRSFRNWFQPHYPYVFAKFRCVRQSG